MHNSENPQVRARTKAVALAMLALYDEGKRVATSNVIQAVIKETHNVHLDTRTIGKIISSMKLDITNADATRHGNAPIEFMLNDLAVGKLGEIVDFFKQQHELPDLISDNYRAQAKSKKRGVVVGSEAADRRVRTITNNLTQIEKHLDSLTRTSSIKTKQPWTEAIKILRLAVADVELSLEKGKREARSAKIMERINALDEDTFVALENLLIPKKEKDNGSQES